MVTCCAFCGADLSNRPETGVFGRVEERCPDCGLAAGADVPTLVPTEEEMVYDVHEWRTRDRLLLARTLVERDVPFRWEPGPVLAVHEDDVGLVEAVLDELDDIDPGDDEEEDDPTLLAAGWPGDDGGAGEVAHRAMVDLFVVADRLRKSGADAVAAWDVRELVTTIGAVPPPYGVEVRVWEDLRRLGTELQQAVDAEAEDERVAELATALRDRLRPLV